MQKLKFFFNVILLIYTRIPLALGEHSLEETSLGAGGGDIPKPHIMTRLEGQLSCTINSYFCELSGKLQTSLELV